jgi:hypothetical protein
MCKYVLDSTSVGEAHVVISKTLLHVGVMCPAWEEGARKRNSNRRVANNFPLSLCSLQSPLFLFLFQVEAVIQRYELWQGSDFVRISL